MIEYIPILWLFVVMCACVGVVAHITCRPKRTEIDSNETPSEIDKLGKTAKRAYLSPLTDYENPYQYESIGSFAAGAGVICPLHAIRQGRKEYAISGRAGVRARY